MIKVDTAIGANLRRYRDRKGLTQRDVAQRVGVTPQQIQKYESGSSRVSADALIAFADILDTPILDLLSRPSEARSTVQALADLALLNDDVATLADLIVKMDQISRQRVLNFAQLAYASAAASDEIAA